jgi:hypothetical protein
MQLYAVALSMSPESRRTLAPVHTRLLEVATGPPLEEAIQRALAVLHYYEVRRRLPSKGRVPLSVPCGVPCHTRIARPCVRWLGWRPRD